MYCSLRSRWVLGESVWPKPNDAKSQIPLSLTIQLLSPGHGGFAIGFRTTSFGRLAIFILVSIVTVRKYLSDRPTSSDLFRLSSSITSTSTKDLEEIRAQRSLQAGLRWLSCRPLATGELPAKLKEMCPTYHAEAAEAAYSDDWQSPDPGDRRLPWRTCWSRYI